MPRRERQSKSIPSRGDPVLPRPTAHSRKEGVVGFTFDHTTSAKNHHRQSSYISHRILGVEG